MARDQFAPPLMKFTIILGTVIQADMQCLDGKAFSFRPMSQRSGSSPKASTLDRFGSSIRCLKADNEPSSLTLRVVNLGSRAAENIKAVDV